MGAPSTPFGRASSLLLACALACLPVTAYPATRIADTDDVGQPYLPGALARSSEGLVVMASAEGVRASQDDGRSFGPRAGPRAEMVAAARGGIVDIVSGVEDWTHSPSRWTVHRRSVDGGLSFGADERTIPGELPLAMSTADDGQVAVVTRNPINDRHALSVLEEVSQGFHAPLPLPDATSSYQIILGLVALGGGEAIACYHTASSYSVGCARTADGGRSFEPIVVVMPSTPATGYLGVVLTRAPSGELVVAAHVIDGGTAVARSADGGRSWSAPELVNATDEVVTSVAVDATGKTWVLSDGGRSVWTSGTAWTQVDLPTPDCAEGYFGMLAWGDGNLLVGGFRTLLSTDGGASWEGPFAPRGIGSPVIAAELAAESSGRLVALWLEHRAAVVEARASVSDDLGATWTPPVRVDDRPVSWDLPDSTQNPAPWAPWALSSSRGGDVVAVWTAIAEDAAPGCYEVRASRSPDGIAWSPSTHIGFSDHGAGITLVDDGFELVALWAADPLTTQVSTSLDSGATWSPPQPITIVDDRGAGFAGVFPARPGELAGVMFSRSPLELWVYISSDGGRNWMGRLAASDTSNNDLFRAVAGGPRILAAAIDRDGVDPTVAFASDDQGRTWQPIAVPNGVPLAGDALGNTYWTPAEYTPYDGLPVDLLPLFGPARTVGSLSARSGAANGVVTIPPDELGLAYGLWSSYNFPQRPGLFFQRSGAAGRAGIQRDDSSRSLSPRPDLARLFPLVAYGAMAAAPGLRDPDLSVMTDASRPLVLYGLGFASAGPLLLAPRWGWDDLGNWVRGIHLYW